MKSRLYLIGYPRFVGIDGEQIDIRSKKGLAILAMLATARHCERSRAWLQEKLWGTRESAQAKASLRKEIANLRKALGGYRDIVLSTSQTVKLDLQAVQLVFSEPTGWANSAGEFLEGLDIPGEEGFEDWLRETRSQLAHAGREVAAEAVSASGSAKSRPHVQVEPRNFKPAIRINSVRIDGNLDESERRLVARVHHKMISSLRQLRWVNVCLAQSPGGERSHPGESAECVGDYSLDMQCWFSDDSLHAEVTLVSKQNNKVIWNGIRQFTAGAWGDDNDETIFASVNLLARQIDLAEQRAAIGAAGVAQDRRAQFARLRHDYQRFDRRNLGEIARRIEELESEGPWSNELALIKASNLALRIRFGEQAESRYEHVRRLCEDILQLDPEEARALTILATIDIWCGRFASAMSRLEEAMALRPGNALCHALKGCCRLLTGDEDGAVAALETAFRIDGYCEHRQFIVGHLAIVLAEAGDIGRARNLVRELRTFEPNAELASFLDYALEKATDDSNARAERDRDSSDLRSMLRRPQTWLIFREILSLEPVKSTRTDLMLDSCDGLPPPR